MRQQGEMMNIIPEEGWPCQRLRIGYGLILFFFFETFIGQTLGPVMPILMLGGGIACLASAVQAIRDWQQSSKIAVLVRALDEHRRR